MADNKKVEEIDISVLFNEETSEETKAKIKTVFESAVEARAAEMVESKIAEIEEAAEEYKEYVAEEIAEELAEAADAYLSYVAEKWLEENAVPMESAIKVEWAESVLESVIGVVTEHNLEIPEGSENVLESMAERVEAMESRLNDVLRENMELREAVELAAISDSVDRLSEGLTDTQAKKLRNLAEGIKFSDAADFAKKLSSVKESFFKESVKAEDLVDGDTAIVEDTKKDAPAVSADPIFEAIMKRATERL